MVLLFGAQLALQGVELALKRLALRLRLQVCAQRLGRCGWQGGVDLADEVVEHLVQLRAFDGDGLLSQFVAQLQLEVRTIEAAFAGKTGM